MNVVEVETGRRIKALILPLNSRGRKLPETRFGFDWKKESIHNIYKLQIVATKEVSGLNFIPIIFYPEVRVNTNLKNLSE